DDLRFYEVTTFNEEYYVEQEREFVRQSNLESEFQEREEKYLQESRESRLLVQSKPFVISPTVQATDTSLPVANSSRHARRQLSRRTSLYKRRYQ
ncbi:MAG: hypothetical protein MOB07_30185, partial [Acidobacteria bacterium]|nr:hypothetical protein [Acidobacteriota bacterium]